MRRQASDRKKIPVTNSSTPLIRSDSAGPAPQPPHLVTLEALMSEVQDAIDRDQQFLIRGEELLAKWKAIAHRMQERLREVLGIDKSISR
jgi:hypothetical protein